MLDEAVMEIATKEVVTVTPDTPITKAIGIMEENHFHNLVVVDERGELYLVTMHDLLLASSVHEHVGELMFKPHCIHKDTPVMDAVCELIESGQRAAPIVDDKGKLVGIVTDYDIMKRAATSKILKDVEASKIMTRNPITIHEDESIGKARSLMRKHNVGRLIVVDDEENPIGIVTEDDILKKIFKPKRRMTVGEYSGEKTPRMEQPVKSIMSSPLITADVKDSVADVAKLMQEYDIRGVPIVKNKILRGIVTRLDIMKYIADLKKGAMIEVEIHGALDEDMRILAERIIATEVRKMVKHAGRIHWIKITIKREHDKGGTPYYHITVYVKTPNKLYVGDASPKLSKTKRLEAEGEDVGYISEKQRWDFIEVLKNALISVEKQIDADRERYHPRTLGKKLREEEIE
ncbi:CBS domain-containing protein [Methanotorris formicicus]|uniref:Putative signal transduction protein with CBS domains n=1 Tax=Methanotorris formicicus Mc-S-70 TaxID=647171 RepID=H1KZG9_9EURY|nr:CBS domain-containing protein [Methanotorris formicicus]EHP85977.1 putative signal transduction protein with CBS domains [Methanotorris formicicus Mc-S-70]